MKIEAVTGEMWRFFGEDEPDPDKASDEVTVYVVSGLMVTDGEDDCAAQIEIAEGELHATLRKLANDYEQKRSRLKISNTAPSIVPHIWSKPMDVDDIERELKQRHLEWSGNKIQDVQSKVHARKLWTKRPKRYSANKYPRD